MQTPWSQVSVPGQSESDRQPTHRPETRSQIGNDGNARAHESPASPSQRGMQAPLGLSETLPLKASVSPRRSHASPAGHTEESAQPQVPRIPESGEPPSMHEGVVVAVGPLAQSASLAQPQTLSPRHFNDPGQL